MVSSIKLVFLAHVDLPSFTSNHIINIEFHQAQTHLFTLYPNTISYHFLGSQSILHLSASISFSQLTILYSQQRLRSLIIDMGCFSSTPRERARFEAPYDVRIFNLDSR